jgi:integrase
MASYLWVRGQTWFFQLRPPSDLKPILGSTPFRVRLPVQTRREASRFARHLAGLAERWFSSMRYKGFSKLRVHVEYGDESWTDQDHRELQASIRQRFMETFLAEVQRINRETEKWETFERIKATAAPADRETIANEQNRIFDHVTTKWNEFAKNLLEDYETVFSDMQSKSRALQETARKLDNLNESYRDDFYDWKDKVSKISAEARENDIARQTAHEINTTALAEMRDVVRKSSDIQSRLLYEGPKLSECIEQFIAEKAKQLPATSREPAYFKHRLDAFLSFVEDKPIATYSIADLGLFADRLRHLPNRHTVNGAWRGKSLKEALEENSSKVGSARAVTLSQTTVRANYIGKIKTAFRWLCAEHKVKYPFAYAHVLIPTDLPTPAERYSLDADQINALFKKCASESHKKRPEDVWLPLLAYLTGARLGELVGLQVTDIIVYNKEDVVDLSTRVKDENGIRNRQIKNSESRRRFVLHRKLRELGFIDWVEEQRKAGHKFLFPDLHRAVRPTHAASKRFQRLFRKSLKMESEYVFHSLRHTFKDWTRDEEVPERTIALQAGHALDGIALNYGSKRLRPKEITRIASLNIQKGVNLDVFKGIPFTKSAPPERKPPLNERIPLLRARDSGAESPMMPQLQIITKE